MTTKRLIALRLPADLVDWADDYARAQQATNLYARKHGGDHGGKDTGRTALIEQLLVALREGRLLLAPPQGVNPFPLEEREAGLSPEFPILICVFHAPR